MSNELIIVKKSKALKGTVNVDGAKNSVLVLLASTALIDGKFIFDNVPLLEDVFVMVKLLESLGSKVIFDTSKKRLEINSQIKDFNISHDLLSKMRASILVLAPILSRFKMATFGLPGGCNLGKRPLDYHLKALESLGVKFENINDSYCGKLDFFKAGKIVLDYPSVGATETAMLAAVMCSGVTRIINAALEPEIIDLTNFLKKMGADICYELPATIIIKGGCKLRPTNHKIMPDRIEAGSLICAALATKGEIELTNVKPSDMDLFLTKISDMGHIVEISENRLFCKYQKESKSVSLRTAPYPGFPTDLLAPFTVLLAVTPGESHVQEGVFDNRLGHLKKIIKMGADIDIYNKTNATIGYTKSLNADNLSADNLRAAFALAIAGMVSEGTTIISGVNHWRRGYGETLEKLKKLGADIDIVYEDYLDNEKNINFEIENC